MSHTWHENIQRQAIFALTEWKWQNSTGLWTNVTMLESIQYSFPWVDWFRDLSKHEQKINILKFFSSWHPFFCHKKILKFFLIWWSKIKENLLQTVNHQSVVLHTEFLWMKSMAFFSTMFRFVCLEFGHSSFRPLWIRPLQYRLLRKLKQHQSRKFSSKTFCQPKFSSIATIWGKKSRIPSLVKQVWNVTESSLALECHFMSKIWWN